MRCLDQFTNPVDILFTDVDDTLTWQGRLPPSTFDALYRLREAGITVIPVTGASAGWCDCIVRTWPVDWVIGESGGMWLERDHSGLVTQHFHADAAQRKRNKQRLEQLVAQLRRYYPEIDYAQDQPFRLTEVALDINQQASVSPEVASKACQWLQQQAVNAKLSSIHINAWLGDYNKAVTASLLVEKLAKGQQPSCGFIGDSANDESMFQRFSPSVGVANIQPLLEKLTHRPGYITSQPGGFGFVELAEKLLQLKLSS